MSLYRALTAFAPLIGLLSAIAAAPDARGQEDKDSLRNERPSYAERYEETFGLNEDGRRSYAERYRDNFDPNEYREGYRDNYRRNLYFLNRSNRFSRYTNRIDRLESARGPSDLEGLNDPSNLIDRGRRTLNVPKNTSSGGAPAMGVSSAASLSLLRPPSLLRGYLSGQLPLSAARPQNATSEDAAAADVEPATGAEAPPSGSPAQVNIQPPDEPATEEPASGQPANEPQSEANNAPGEPVSPPALMGPSELLFQRGLEAFQQRRYGKARGLFEQMNTIIEPNADMMIAHGLSLVASRGYAEAAEVLREAFERLDAAGAGLPYLSNFYAHPRDFEIHLRRVERNAARVPGGGELRFLLEQFEFGGEDS